MKKLEITELTSMREILEMAMEREKSALEFYTQAADKSVLRAEKEMFLKLAEEEKVHHRKLQQQLEEIQAQLEIDRAITGELF